MAATLTLRGVHVKRRNPWGAWALNLVTLGIYGMIHWNRMNIELRDYSAAIGRPFRNDPNRSLLAMFAGSLVLIPYFVTRGREPVSETVSVLLGILAGAHVVYLQRSLNEIWDAEATAVPQPRGLTPAPLPG
jgi:hypothetical protein